MRSYKTQAIVLKRVNYGEADRIITCFTPEYGKITVNAKGVRRITSKRAPHLEVFTHASLCIYRGASRDLLTEATSITTFPTLREDFSKTSTAFRIIEELERLSAEHVEATLLFNILLKALIYIDEQPSDDELLHRVRERFSHRLLWEMGYLPSSETLKDEALDQFVENILESKLKSKLLIEV